MNQQTSIQGILSKEFNKSIRTSKGKRVSWGGTMVKEFGKNEIPVNQSDIKNIELNNIEEEVSNQSDLSPEIINQNQSIDYPNNFNPNNPNSNNNNRLTIQNIIPHRMSIDSTKENIQPESSEKQKENQMLKRVTILNVKDILPDSTIQNSLLNPMTVIQNNDNNTQSEKTLKNKRITISIQEAYSNLLKGEIEDDDKEDDIHEVTTEELMNSNTKKNSITNKEHYHTIYNSSPKAANQIASFNNLKPLMSPIVKYNTKISLSARKVVNPDDLSEIEKKARITIMNARDILTGSSHSKKKNPIIENSIIYSPVSKIKSRSFGNNIIEENETNFQRIQRLQSNYNSLVDESNNKKNNIRQLQSEILLSENKKKEFEIEHESIEKEKEEIMKQIEILEQENKAMQQKLKIQKVLQNFLFEIRVISIGIEDINHYAFELYFLKRVKIKFVVSNSIFTGDNVTIYSILPLIYKKDYQTSNVLDKDKNPKVYSQIQEAYNDILKQHFHINTEMPIKDLILKLKQIIKISASYLHLIDLLNDIYTISDNVAIDINLDKMLLSASFAILNTLGFQVETLFTIKILDSFLGIDLINYQIKNIWLDQADFQKKSKKISEVLIEIKKFLSFKHPTQVLFHNFFFDLYDSIQKL